MDTLSQIYVQKVAVRVTRSFFFFARALFEVHFSTHSLLSSASKRTDQAQILVIENCFSLAELENVIEACQRIPAIISFRRRKESSLPKKSKTRPNTLQSRFMVKTCEPSPVAPGGNQLLQNYRSRHVPGDDSS